MPLVSVAKGIRVLTPNQSKLSLLIVGSSQRREAVVQEAAQEIKRLELRPLIVSENEYGEDAERLAAKDIATLERFFS